MKKFFVFVLAVILTGVSSCAWAYFTAFMPSTVSTYVGANLEIHISTAGGYDNYSYSARGNMPPGCSLSYDDITGTPTKAGRYIVMITARARCRDYVYRNGKFQWEYSYESSYPNCLIKVKTALPDIVAASHDTGEFGRPYEYKIDTKVYYGDASGLVWGVTSGDFPEGLSLDKGTGIISGTPTATGEYKFTVIVSNDFTTLENVSEDHDSYVNAAKKEFTITINAPEFAITTTTLPEGTAGTPYTANFLADIEGVTWSSENLPEWLTLNAETGELSGTPAEAEEYTFKVRATIGTSYVEREYTITITGTTNNPATPETPSTQSDPATPETPGTPGEPTTPETPTTSADNPGSSSGGGCNSGLGVLAMLMLSAAVMKSKR